MRKIEFSGNEYILGLTWYSLTGEHTKQESEHISEDMGLDQGTVREFAIENGLISQLGLTGNSKARGTASAAAVLADIEQNVFVIQDIDETMAWACLIIGNEVISGGDIIFKQEIAASKCNELFELAGNDLSGFTVIAGEGHEHFCEKFENPSIYESVDDFLGEFVEDDIAKLRKKYLVSNLRKMSREKIIAISFLSVLLVGFAIINSTGDSKEEIMQNIAPMGTTLQTLNPEQESLPVAKTTEEKLEEAKEEEISWFKSDLESNSSSSTITNISNFIAIVPKSVGGWKPIYVRYSKKNKNNAVLHWANEHGTSLTWLSALSELPYLNTDKVEYGLEGKTAGSSHPVIAVEKRPLIQTPDQFIAENKYRHQMLMHDLTSQGYKWVMTEYEHGNRKEPIEDIANVDLSLTKQYQPKAKTVLINQSGLNNLLALVDTLELAKTFMINEIEFDINSRAWSVTGEIYEN